MEALFHFIFELIKISILGSIYGTFIFVPFLIIRKFIPQKWLAKVPSEKSKLWFYSVFSVSVGLFLFMLSYWGNHGLGDNARVPIGHFKVVKAINANDVYIEKGGHNQLAIKKFSFDNKNLYAEVQQKFDDKIGNYVVWNLRNNKWTFYKTKKDYLVEITRNNYPNPTEFEGFSTHYARRWSGWKFWALP